eukprot:378575-Hanusia_phi.AAC.1
MQEGREGRECLTDGNPSPGSSTQHPPPGVMLESSDGVSSQSWAGILRAIFPGGRISGSWPVCEVAPT